MTAGLRKTAAIGVICSYTSLPPAFSRQRCATVYVLRSIVYPTSVYPTAGHTSDTRKRRTPNAPHSRAAGTHRLSFPRGQLSWRGATLSQGKPAAARTAAGGEHQGPSAGTLGDAARA